MTDQSTLQYLENEALLAKLPGLKQVPFLTPETMRSQIELTISHLLILIEQEIETLDEGEKVNLIFPMDGGYIVYHELMKVLKSSNKVNIVFAAKTYTIDNGTDYVLSPGEIVGKAIIVDDIYDRGESSELIKKKAGIPDENSHVIALSTKQGRNFDNNAVPIFEYEDMWVASGFGMNSGKFGAMEVINSGEVLQENVKVLKRMHQTIEILERMCGASFLVQSSDLLEGWRFNVESLRDYIQLLNQNCLYEKDEFFKIFEKLKELQGKSALGKFGVLSGLTEG